MKLSLLFCLLSAAAVVGLVTLPTADLVKSQLGKKRTSSECATRDYRQNVLKLVKETPFAGLFRDVKNMTKFEASGLAAVRGRFYVVFDSSFALGSLDDEFAFRGQYNTLIGEPGTLDSQFEGIAYVPENDTFLLLHEALPSSSSSSSDDDDDDNNNNNKENDDEPYTPFITEIQINGDGSDYKVLSQCAIDFVLTHANKGFESIMYVRTLEGESFLLGLCEGNFCSGGREGRDPGNGRIVVSQLEWFAESGCVWKPVKTINIPSAAYFRDYSGMALNYATGKLAVLSQEGAAVWIGNFDIEAMDFKTESDSEPSSFGVENEENGLGSGGGVFHLPRNDVCQMVYCNAEGIQWLDNYRLLVASDKAKSSQPVECVARDQSIHIFAMPSGWNPY